MEGDSEGHRVEAEACDAGIVSRVEVDDLRTAGAAEALDVADMFVLAAGSASTDNERTGQTEMGREGKIDGLSERGSSAQLLLFCVIESIFLRAEEKPNINRTNHPPYYSLIC